MMKSTRRENIALVAGHKIWRHRTRLPLTPYAVRLEMVAARRVVQTQLDMLLAAAEADALERWAANEQVLDGKAKTQSWGNTANGAGKKEFAPISDHRIAAVQAHCENKKRLDSETLEVLAAFTAMQNRHQAALSAAQYGIALCPYAKNKAMAFYDLVKAAGQTLVHFRY